MCKSASSCFHDAWLTRVTQEHASAIMLANLAEYPGCAGSGEDGGSPALLLHRATILGSEQAPRPALDH